LVPQGKAKRLFTIFYLLFGVLVLATVVFGFIFENVFEAYDGILNRARALRGNTFLSKFQVVKAPGAKGADVVSERHQDGNSTRSFLSSSEHDGRYISVDMLREFFVVCPLFALVLIGALFIGKVEGWDVFDSIYFMVTTSTTGKFHIHMH